MLVKKSNYFIDFAIIGTLLTNEIDKRVVVLVLEQGQSEQGEA